MRREGGGERRPAHITALECISAALCIFADNMAQRGSQRLRNAPFWDSSCADLLYKTAITGQKQAKTLSSTHSQCFPYKSRTPSLKLILERIELRNNNFKLQATSLNFALKAQFTNIAGVKCIFRVTVKDTHGAEL